MAAPAPSRTGLRQRAASLADTALSICTVLLATCAVSSEAARHFWFAELLANFRVQFAVGLAFCAAACFLRKKRRLSAAALAIALLPLLHVIAATPWDAQSASRARTIKLMTFNVEGANDHVDQIEQTILRNAPDILLILEWREKHTTLNLAAAGLTPVMLLPREDNFGVALFARIPADTSAVRYWGAPDMPPGILASFQVDGHLLTIAGIHPPPPVAPRAALRRNALLLAAAAELGQESGARVLAGDFNLTPWTPVFADVLAAGGLRDSREGGLHTTWTAHWPLYPWFLIPIDHVLVSPEITVGSRQEGDASGSDHFPVVTTISF